MFSKKALNTKGYKDGHRGGGIDTALYNLHQERMQKLQDNIAKYKQLENK